MCGKLSAVFVQEEIWTRYFNSGTFLGRDSDLRCCCGNDLENTGWIKTLQGVLWFGWNKLKAASINGISPHAETSRDISRNPTWSFFITQLPRFDMVFLVFKADCLQLTEQNTANPCLKNVIKILASSIARNGNLRMINFEISALKKVVKEVEESLQIVEESLQSWR